MADIMDKLSAKIKQGEVKKSEGKLGSDYRSYVYMKKLMECDWRNADHKPLIVEAFGSLVNECDDEMAEKFVDRIVQAVKEVGEEIVASLTQTNPEESPDGSEEHENAETPEEEAAEHENGEEEPDEAI